MSRARRSTHDRAAVDVDGDKIGNIFDVYDRFGLDIGDLVKKFGGGGLGKLIG